MRDVHQRDSQGICTRLFFWWDVDRPRERGLEWLLVDVSIAIRSWGSWSPVSTRRRRLGLDSMLAGLFVPFEVRIQFDATMERHGWSVRGHRRTDDNEWLKEEVIVWDRYRFEQLVRHLLMTTWCFRFQSANRPMQITDAEQKRFRWKFV